jgi:hypothetical protein
MICIFCEKLWDTNAHPDSSANGQKQYPFVLIESIMGSREDIMNSRKLLISSTQTAIILYLVTFPLILRAWTSQANNTTQDQNKAETAKTASDDQVKEKAPDMKSAPTDEGQLATVNDAKIPSYSKVYVAPISGGFENYIIAGLRNKRVPLTVVIDRSKADYEISGVSDSEKAGWAKMLFIGSQNSNEQASIKISDLKTGAVIFGYSVHKTNSVRGKQSAGEACAKHIKKIVLD